MDQVEIATRLQQEQLDALRSDETASGADETAAQSPLPERTVWLETLLHDSLDLFAEIGLDGTYYYASPNHRAILGYTPEELLTANVFALVHPDDRDKVAESFQVNAAKLSAAREVFRFRDKQGKWRWLESTGKAFRTPEGKIRGAIISRDVTADVQLRQSLAESEARFRSAFDFAPIGMALVGPAGQWLKVNRALCEIVGYSEDELLQTDFPSLTHSEDVERSLEALNELISGAVGAVKIEKRYIHKQGHIVWVQISSSVVRDAERRYLYAIAQIRDITERLQRQHELLRINQAVAASSDAIAIADPDLIHIYQNNAFDRLFGYTVEEMAVLGGAVSLDVNQDFARAAIEVLRERGTWHGEAVLKSRNGQRVPVAVRADAIRDESGAVIGYVGIFTDISERRRAEERRQAMMYGLQAVVTAANELIVCLDVDTVYRHAVELGQSLLGLERCGVYLVDRQHNVVHGTYGVDRHGGVIAVHDLEFPLDGDFWQRSLQAPQDERTPHWRVEHDVPLTAYAGGRTEEIARGWVAITPILSEQIPVGVFCNDTALSGAAFDPVKQEMVTVYCSLLGTILDGKRAAERWRALYKGLPIPTYTYEMAGGSLVLQDYNDAARELTRGNVSQFVGKGIEEIIAARPDIVESSYRCYAERTTFTREMDYWLQTAQRQARLRVTYAYVPPDLVIIHTEDITEQHNLQDQLRKSLDRYRGLFLGSGDGILFAEPGTGRITDANPKAQEITGRNLDELRGTTLHVLSSAADSTPVGETVNRVGVPADGPVTRELAIQRPDGVAVPVELTAQAVDQESEPVVQIVLRDGTLESEARRASRLLADVLDTSAAAILGLDDSGHVLLSNRRACDLFGYDEAELRGLPLSALLQTDSGGPVSGAAGEEGRTSSQQVTATTRGGEEFPALITLSPMRSAVDRRDVAQVCVISDITAHQQTQRELERASRLAALGHLVAGVAHEINNPLTTIVVSASTALNKNLDEEDRRECADRLVTESRRLARVVRDLLRFAREDTPHRAYLNMVALLRYVESMWRHQCELDGIEFVVKLQTDVPDVCGDENQLQMVIFNLLSNAKDAVAQCLHPRIELLCTKADDGLEIVVRDNGIGMTEKVQDHAFDPFFTTKPTGTGLGLSMTHSTINQHDGTVRLESRPGAGTAVRIYLPAGNEPEDDEEEAEDESPAAPLIEGRLLVIDDEVNLRLVLSTALRNYGYEAEFAANAAEAREVLRADTGFDAVLCDIRMPDMDGRDLYRELVQSYPVLRDRFVFMTGDTMNQETSEFLQSTSAGWLAKPFDVDELVKTINAHRRPDAAR